MKRIKQLFDWKELNNLLDDIEKYSNIKYNQFYEDRDIKRESLRNSSFVKFNPKLVTVTTRYGKDFFDIPCTYIFSRDDEALHLKQGSEEYSIFSRACGNNLPDWANDEWTINNLGKQDGKFLNKQTPILKYNPDFNHQENVHVYQYDLNSAYLGCIYKKWLDTNNPIFNSKLQENQVGFFVTDKLEMCDKPGTQVDIAFPLIDTPDSIKRYCDRWFERKSQKENLLLKKNAKYQIVDSIGYLQYHNPYLRAWIVESCNNKIQSLIDKHSDIFVLANTDAIFTTEKIDVEIGDKLGQFKCEEGYITLDGVNYTSKEFGNKIRGKQKANYYTVVNNRLVKVEENCDE